MFSSRSLVVGPDSFDDSTADRLATLLTGLSAQPAKARDHRSAVIVSFEKLGVTNPAADPRARGFLRRLHQGCPGLGYFLHGDPPGYHLRDVLTALAIADGRLKGEAFLRVHDRLYQGGAAFGLSVGSNADALVEVFTANLLPAIMPASVRGRAMRALLPVLLMARDSEKLPPPCLREAEALWGRKPADFPSTAAFIAAFAEALREP